MCIGYRKYCVTTPVLFYVHFMFRVVSMGWVQLGSITLNSFKNNRLAYNIESNCPSSFLPGWLVWKIYCLCPSGKQIFTPIFSRWSLPTLEKNLSFAEKCSTILITVCRILKLWPQLGSGFVSREELHFAFCFMQAGLYVSLFLFYSRWSHILCINPGFPFANKAALIQICFRFFC